MKFQVYFVMLCLSYPQVKYSGKEKLQWTDYFIILGNS